MGALTQRKGSMQLGLAAACVMLGACSSGQPVAPRTPTPTPRQAAGKTRMSPADGVAPDGATVATQAPGASEPPLEPGKPSPGPAADVEAPAKEPRTRAELARDAQSLVQAKRWAEALDVYEELERQSSKPRQLAELGYVAWKAGKLERATTANDRALAAAWNDDELQAMILYNQGRVEEDRGRLIEAVALYEQAAKLKPSEAIERRRVALPGIETSCAAPRSLELFCRCGRAKLVVSAYSSDVISGFPLVVDKATPGVLNDGQCLLGQSAFDGRLRAVTYGYVGNYAPLVLVDVNGDQVRQIAELDKSYEPGAFGISYSVEPVGFRAQSRHGHQWAVFEWTVNDVDQDMGGLEIHSSVKSMHTLCTVAPNGEVTCPLSIAVKTVSSFQHRPEEAKGDPELYKQLLEAAKSDFEATTTYAYTVEPDGTVRVRHVAGERFDAKQEPWVAGGRLW